MSKSKPSERIKQEFYQKFSNNEKTRNQKWQYKYNLLEMLLVNIVLHGWNIILNIVLKTFIRNIFIYITEEDPKRKSKYID